MALTIEQHPCWVVTCDKCGEGDNFDYGGSFHHPDEATARESLQSADWVELPTGAWLCSDCFDALRGELPCPHGGRCTGGCGDACPTPTVEPS